jgi:hypothetical protein
MAQMSNGQSQSITIGWQSDISTVARVTDGGMVTGVGNGRANIYVVSGGKQGPPISAWSRIILGNGAGGSL